MKNRYRKGDYNVISDLSGMKFKRSQCKMGEPGSLISGLLVGPGEWAPRHPQLDIRPVAEDIGVRDGRPRQPDRYSEGQSPNDSKEQFIYVAQFDEGLYENGPAPVTGTFSITIDVQADELINSNNWLIDSLGNTDAAGDYGFYIQMQPNNRAKIGIQRVGDDLATYSALSDEFIFSADQQQFGVTVDGEDVSFYRSISGKLTLINTVNQPGSTVTNWGSKNICLGGSAVFPVDNWWAGLIYSANVRSGGVYGVSSAVFDAQDYTGDPVIVSNGSTWTPMGGVTILEERVI